MALAPSSSRASAGRHVVLPDMHAVGFRRERHVDAVVDEQRNALGRQHRRKPRASSTMARVEPCLSRNCTSVALPAMRAARSASVRPPATAGSTRA